MASADSAALFARPAQIFALALAPAIGLGSDVLQTVELQTAPASCLTEASTGEANPTAVS